MGLTESARALLIEAARPLRARVSSADTEIDRKRRIVALGALVVIVVIGFVLRVYAIGWSLPYVTHPDEPSAANTALGMIRRGDWNPRFFKKPSLYYYALRIAFDAQYRYGLATGLYADISQLPLGTYYYVNTPGLFVWGRMLSVLFGTATLLVVYAIGKRWWGSAVGIIAAVVLAVLPFHVRQSQFITVDVLTGLMSALALWAGLRVLEDSRWRAYALAGLLIGLATSAKYNAAAVALALIVAHGFHWGRASLRQFLRLPWAALWSAIGFLIVTPYALLTPSAFYTGIFKQVADYSDSPSGDLVNRWPVGGYLNFFWTQGLLPLPCIAVCIGIFIVIRRRDRAGLVMLGFALPYLLFVMAQREHFFRNLLPIFPVLVLLTGIGVLATAIYLRDLIARRRAESAPPTRSRFGLGMLLLTGAVISQPLVTAIAADQLFARPYSKIRAAEYVRDQLPHGAPIAVALNPVAWANQPLAPVTENVAEHDADWYRDQGYRYLVGDVRVDPQGYRALRAQARVLAEFPGELDGQSSPQMEVLDLGLALDQLAIERQETGFGDSLQLLGFQRGAGKLRPEFTPLTGAASVKPGQALRLNLYWLPLKAMPTDYAFFLHLIDAQGKVVAQRDTLIRGNDYPTSHWRSGELVVDLADLAIPDGLPADTYKLEMGVYDMQTMARLPIAGVPDAARVLMDVQVAARK